MLKRGFAIGVPGLDRSLLSPTITFGNYVFMQKYDILLRVVSCQNRPGATRVEMQTGCRTTTILCRAQRGQKVAGIRRIAVLHFCKRVREVEAPHLVRTNFKTISAQNLDDGVVLWSNYNNFPPLDIAS